MDRQVETDRQADTLTDKQFVRRQTVKEIRGEFIVITFVELRFRSLRVRAQVTESALSAPSVAIHFACEALGKFEGGDSRALRSTRPLGVQIRANNRKQIGVVF